MPHKTKVAMKTMLEACQIYLSGKASYDQIAESLGVGRTSVRRWGGSMNPRGLTVLPRKKATVSIHRKRSSWLSWNT